MMEPKGKHEEKDKGVITIDSKRSVGRWRNGHLDGYSLSSYGQARSISRRLANSKETLPKLNKLSEEPTQ